MPFCANCGKQLPDDFKFCTGCGSAVGAGADGARQGGTSQVGLVCLKGFQGMFVAPVRTLKELSRLSSFVPGIAAAVLAAVLFGLLIVLLLKSQVAALGKHLGEFSFLFSGFFRKINYGAVFFRTVLGFLIFFAVDAGLLGLLLMAPWFKTTVDKKSILLVNVVGLSALYSAAAFLAGIVLNFINTGLTLAVLISGVMLTFFSRHFGLVTAGALPSEKIYGFVAAHTAVYVFFAYLAFLIAME